MDFEGNGIINSSDLSEIHRSQICRILQMQGVMSRAEIAKITGLTQASVSKIAANLIEMGIVSEVGSIKGNGNRRAIGLKLNAKESIVIGVKFSRHLCSVGAFDLTGNLKTSKDVDFSGVDTREAIVLIKEQIHAFLHKYENAAAIGLALPGPYIRAEGRFAMMTQMTMWRDINFQEVFENEFDVPLFIEQDANAGALAEWFFGTHDKDLSTLAYLFVGEGVGSGVIDRGRLIRGAQGAASEVGHISIDVNGPRCECGNYGCLELYLCLSAVLKRAQKEIPEILAEAGENRIDQYRSIVDASKSGNEKAHSIIADVANYIAYGCVTLINAYNPDIIVIGDSLSYGGDYVLSMIREAVRERTIPDLYKNVTIEMSTLQIDPVLRGAAAIAADEVLKRPSEYLSTNVKTKE